MSNHGAIAEGPFPGIGWLSSLGKAGVNKDGTLKSNACKSPESAKKSAIKTLVNKLRFTLGGKKGMISIEYPDLSDEQLSIFEEEIMAVVSWEYLGGNLSKACISHKMFSDVMKRAVA
jgi:hypothetical protein